MQRAIYEQLRQYPGQEKQILDFFRSQPGAAASIRAPIFEEKVIDHLLTEIDVTDKKVTKEELLADEEGEGSGKDAKKAAPKKKAAAKAEAAEGEEAAAPKKKGRPAEEEGFRGRRRVIFGFRRIHESSASCGAFLFLPQRCGAIGRSRQRSCYTN